MANIKFGKLATRVDRRTIKLAAILRPDKLPPIPDTYDLYAALGFSDSRMFLNDQLGDCVIAQRAHQTLAFEKFEQGQVVPITDAEVKAEYEAETGGPDVGLIMLDSLNKWRHDGWAAAGRNYKIHAFASIDWRNHQEVKEAIYLFTGVAFGMQVPQSAIDDFEAGKYYWDVKPDDGGIAGGHAVYAPAYMAIGGYDTTGPVCLTWGRRVQMTWAFWDRYVDEAYAIIDSLDDWLAPATDPLDVPKLEQYLSEITGQPVPPDEPPAPPAPPVPPTPGGCFAWRWFKRQVAKLPRVTRLTVGVRLPVLVAEVALAAIAITALCLDHDVIAAACATAIATTLDKVITTDSG